MSAANPNASTSLSAATSSVISRQRVELKLDKYNKPASNRMSSSGGVAVGGVGGGFTSAGASSDAATPGGSPVPVVKEKRMTMRAVRNIIRLGRSRQSSQARDSSTEDEGR